MARKTRSAKPEIVAADLPVETAPAACGELLDRFLLEKDVRMAGVWFWRSGGAEETDGEFGSIRFSVDNLFSGNMALPVPPVAAAQASNRPRRPAAGPLPVNRIYSGTGCFRYA
ncbi:MAG: hypothetical protein A4E73_04035 [Syntrophaceae bacterium PtaU1.Bin231]|nr:MAG: hypothetical protein A4E73_04035 [Syntrophaceae bacterium PtaU1.Bin231]HOG15871.1 hypothetical protein [Syntrophales bacterium]